MANLNQLAEEITKLEGKRISLPIGQIKEVLGILGRRWRAMTSVRVIDEINSIIKRAGSNETHG